ncbi:MAG: hypothetical protein ABSH08_14050 [Tepidisphaeraceae bacterium]|jgi:hypothetical protein
MIAPNVPARDGRAVNLPLGKLVSTPGALEALAKAGQSGPELIERHRRGNWGAVSAEDWAANDRALADGERILSAYCLKNGVKIWIITEANRDVTTLLLPEEY